MSELQEEARSRRRAARRKELGAEGAKREQKLHVAAARGVMLAKRALPQGVAIASPGRDAIETLRYHRKKKPE